MKKLFAIAFTCVYLLLTVGVIKNTHYCMGRINALTLPLEFNTANSDKDFLKDAPTILYSHHNTVAHNAAKNSPEFFILSDLYSEAYVFLIA